MGKYTSYYLYQKYEKIGSQDWTPVYPQTLSVYSDGTESGSTVIKLYNDTACGYKPSTEVQYRWVKLNPSVDYICDDCELWVASGYICDNGDLYEQLNEQNFDGKNWYYTGIKKKGKLYSMIAEIVKPGTMENIIIKAQHNCFSDNTQYSGSFIPILHEYVLIVRKDSPTAIPVLMCSQKTMDIRDMPGATWRDVVAAVLEDCNGAVSLTYLYEQIEPHKKAQANKWWKEKIRQTLQLNPTHFSHDGRGMWSLNKSIA